MQLLIEVERLGEDTVQPAAKFTVPPSGEAGHAWQPVARVVAPVAAALL